MISNKPFVAQKKKRFDDTFYECAQFFSGNETDMIPMHSANAVGNRVNFQMPGGENITVDVITAMAWARAILEICQAAIVFNEKAEAEK